MAADLRVIEGGGKPEPDTRLLDALAEVAERVKAGEVRGLLIVADTADGEPEAWCAGDDALRTVVLADLVLPSLKAEALGLGE